jgi:succinate dehydrogenase/fumarate reductase-like Fe-S protein
MEAQHQMSHVALRVVRGTPATGARIQDYTVPYEAGMTLLDALIWVRQNVDPTLAVRYSCRANACKECSASMDGRPGYLCATRATEDGTVDIAPLPKPRWIRDLVTEVQ